MPIAPPVRPRYFALIPAAGSGTRMGAGIPKQYAPLAGKPLLQHAVQVLCAHPRIEQVFVVLSPGDERFGACDWSACGDRVSALFCGGETRAASVFNGLLAVNDAVDGSDWVLVHDAARPCLRTGDVDRLIAEVGDSEVGGLLGVPVADTLKRANADREAVHTEAREHLWRAQTPQMFRYGLLLAALEAAGTDMVTDEAQAIEFLGQRPRLVPGDNRNLKVTYPEDLAMAGLILQQEKESACSE